MSNKISYSAMALVIVVFFAFAVAKNEPPDKVRPGLAHEDKGRTHVQSKEYGGDEPPTSGDHASPLSWQVYNQEIPDVNVIHNLEHGGVYISYRPDLPKEQVDKIKSLFSKPYSNTEFSPTKAIVAPRSNNKAPIVMSSWARSESFQSFDEAKMIEYYLANIGKSPEPGAS